MDARVCFSLRPSYRHSLLARLADPATDSRPPQLRPYHRRLLHRDAPHRRPRAPAHAHRHRRAGGVPRPLDDGHARRRRLPARLRHHQRGQPRAPCALLRPRRPRGRRPRRPRRRPPRPYRRRQQVRPPAREAGPRRRGPRVGARTRLRLHGDKRARHGQRGGDVRTYVLCLSSLLSKEPAPATAPAGLFGTSAQMQRANSKSRRSQSSFAASSRRAEPAPKPEARPPAMHRRSRGR